MEGHASTMFRIDVFLPAGTFPVTPFQLPGYPYNQTEFNIQLQSRNTVYNIVKTIDSHTSYLVLKNDKHRTILLRNCVQFSDGLPSITTKVI